MTNYKIRSNNAASGVAAKDVDLGTSVSRAITPTAAGSYTYTITATNSVGKTITKTFVVSVQADPTITSFTATPASVTAGGTTTLSWTTANNGTLSINQSVGTVTGTSKAVNVGTTTGSKTYTLTNSRVLNGVTRTATRNATVSVTVAKTCHPYNTKPATYFLTVDWGVEGLSANIVVNGKAIVTEKVITAAQFKTPSTISHTANGKKYTVGTFVTEDYYQGYYDMIWEKRYTVCEE